MFDTAGRPPAARPGIGKLAGPCGPPARPPGIRRTKPAHAARHSGFATPRRRAHEKPPGRRPATWGRTERGRHSIQASARMPTAFHAHCHCFFSRSEGRPNRRPFALSGSCLHRIVCPAIARRQTRAHARRQPQRQGRAAPAGVRAEHRPGTTRRGSPSREERSAQRYRWNGTRLLFTRTAIRCLFGCSFFVVSLRRRAEPGRLATVGHRRPGMLHRCVPSRAMQ
jgi:hypothetical protein